MIQEIHYNGHTAVPSDYQAPDGDLSLSIGALPEDGSLRPILPPAELLKLEHGETVKYIHNTPSGNHYIILNTIGELKYQPEESSEQTFLRTFDNPDDIHQITAVGNTLIVLYNDGMHYFLWKGGTVGYLYLGTQLPELPLSFGLQGEIIRSDAFTIEFNGIESQRWIGEFTNENKEKVTPQVLGEVNKFIAENSTNKGKFLYPFFVRYAYRLYDGTLTMHSSPILMTATSDLAPQAFIKEVSGGSNITSASLELVGIFHTLDYAVTDISSADKLSQWNDIIKSVDIFVSAPIYTYDPNGLCWGFKRYGEDGSGDRFNIDDAYSICKHINQRANTTTYPLQYQKNNFIKLYAFTFNPNTLEYPKERLVLPSKSDDTIKADIKNSYNFYHLDSIKTEQLSTTRKAITVPEDYLQSLVTREVMTDDYDSHDTLIPQYTFPYNSRLNITNLQKQLFAGYDADAQFPYTDGYVTKADNPLIFNTTYDTRIYIHIKQDDKKIIVQSPYGTFGNKTPLLFIYYPNINAYKATIEYSQYGIPSKFHEIPLEKHAFLNGSFYFGGWQGIFETISESTIAPAPSTDQGRIINIPNKLYTSEVNNPFVFPLLGINTIGTGTILGISSATKALSEGQFGQFPLYAFTSEGVWALEVSSTGSYTARQPITRDVCLNAESITQLDDAVLFATSRGIMLISGSQTQCLTDIINNPTEFSLGELPHAAALTTHYNSKATAHEQLPTEGITIKPLLQYITGARMLYDYTHQRIILYNPTEIYAYVYSLKSQSWGMIRSSLTSGANSYPEALAMSISPDGNPVLVDFSGTGSDDATPLIVTRPFSLGAPDIHKTIDTVIQRGHLPRTAVQQILYGSNDLYNWQPVWSSTDQYLRGFRGTGYKAYRLVLVCKLSKGDTLTGCTVQYTPRQTNRPR